jgi:hypothetical protein
MPRPAISGVVSITFLMLLGFSAVPQEPARKGADTEAAQLTFNNACRTCHTTKEGCAGRKTCRVSDCEREPKETSEPVGRHLAAYNRCLLENGRGMSCGDLAS